MPVGHYEMAVCEWVEYEELTENLTRTLHGEEKAKPDKCLAECASYLDKVAKWEAYDLDTRVGIKVRTAQETLRRTREADAAAG